MGPGEVTNDEFGEAEECKCGAKSGMMHDMGCPAGDERGLGETVEHDPLIEPGAKNHPEDCECPVCNDRGPTKESFSFDKFMTGTLLKEGREKKVDATEVSPQRRIARNYQERPLGRIRMGKRVL